MRRHNFWLFPLTVLSAILYRLGGTGGAWWKNTKVRDLGVAVVAAVSSTLIVQNVPWYAHVLHGFLLFPALTTYHKWLNKLFNPATNEVLWYSWAMTGFCYGFAAIVYPAFNGEWGAWITRCIALAALCTAISVISRTDWIEEGGRGASIILTLPMLGGIWASFFFSSGF